MRPTGPIEAEEVRADHIKIKWKKPKDAGGCPLTGYVIEKMDTDTGRWVPAGEVDADADSFTASGLTPKKKYKFRVKAVNKEGESEALETEDSIMARNPYGNHYNPFVTTQPMAIQQNHRNATSSSNYRSCLRL